MCLRSFIKKVKKKVVLKQGQDPLRGLSKLPTGLARGVKNCKNWQKQGLKLPKMAKKKKKSMCEHISCFNFFFF